MMKPLILLGLAAGLTSCATSTITKRNATLPALDLNAPVKVYADKAPTFNTEVICEAEIDVATGLSSNLWDYAYDARQVARECGADMVLIKRLSGFRGGSGTVDIEAVKKTSEESKFEKQKDMIKKFATAFGVGNISQMEKILAKLEVNKEPKKRSDLDSAVFNKLMRISAERGKSCSTKSMDYLSKNYGAKIDYFADFKAEGSYREESVSTAMILECTSPTVISSFDAIKNKANAVTAINNSLTERLNMGIGMEAEVKNFKKLYPTIETFVKNECQKDSLGSICSLKDNLEKISKIK